MAASDHTRKLLVFPEAHEVSTWYTDYWSYIMELVLGFFTLDGNYGIFTFPMHGWSTDRPTLWLGYSSESLPRNTRSSRQVPEALGYHVRAQMQVLASRWT